MTFSQISGGGKDDKAHYHVIVSETGLVLPSGMTLPYSNEQQPTMVMLLLLSAMVDESRFGLNLATVVKKKMISTNG